MTKYLLIFLMCISFAVAQISWIVGGKGDGSDAIATAGGSYTGDSTWSEAQLVDGGVLSHATAWNGSDNACVVTEGVGNTVICTAPGADDFEDVISDIVANMEFEAGDGDDAYNGRYAVDVIDDDELTIVGLLWSNFTDTVACDIRVGGAFPNPGDVPDAGDTGGVGIAMAAGDKIWVQGSDHDYTTEDESGSLLYISHAGTAAAPIIWEAHSADVTGATIALEKGDFGIATFNANGKTNAIETAVGGNVYHVFIGISCELATVNGANLNGVNDSVVSFIRCQFILNGGWGVQGNNSINIAFCDFDTNTSGGIDVDTTSMIFGNVIRGNTGNGLMADVVFAFNNLIFNNTGTQGINSGAGFGVILGNTIDMNNVAASVGIVLDGSAGPGRLIANNIITDCITGIREDSVSLRQANISYNNLYNSNTTDAHANITPQPVDGDDWGNLVKNVAENALWTADDQTYILQSAYKQAGTDAFYTRKYWDDFNGGAGDNPPNPLTGLSFIDNGALQREESAGGGGGQPVLGGSIVR